MREFPVPLRKRPRRGGAHGRTARRPVGRHRFRSRGGLGCAAWNGFWNSPGGGRFLPATAISAGRLLWRAAGGSGGQLFVPTRAGFASARARAGASWASAGLIANAVHCVLRIGRLPAPSPPGLSVWEPAWRAGAATPTGRPGRRPRVSTPTASRPSSATRGAPCGPAPRRSERFDPGARRWLRTPPWRPSRARVGRGRRRRSLVGTLTGGLARLDPRTGPSPPSPHPVRPQHPDGTRRPRLGVPPRRPAARRAAGRPLAVPPQDSPAGTAMKSSTRPSATAPGVCGPPAPAAWPAWRERWRRYTAPMVCAPLRGLYRRGARRLVVDRIRGRRADHLRLKGTGLETRHFSTADNCVRTGHLRQSRSLRPSLARHRRRRGRLRRREWDHYGSEDGLIWRLQRQRFLFDRDGSV